MDRLKKNLLTFLILLLFVSIVVIYRSFLLTYIIEPVALLFWAIWRIVSSMDQSIYWIVLIAICIYLVIRFIPYENDVPRSSAYSYMNNSPNRVEYWQTTLEDAVFGKNEREYLRDSLEKLVFAVIPQIERQDSTEGKTFITKEKISLSPAAYRYLFSPTENPGRFSINHLPNIMFLLPRRLRKRVMMFIHQDNTLIDEILTWMENELEISNE